MRSDGPGANETDQALERGLAVFGVDVELVLVPQWRVVIIGKQQRVGLDAMGLQGA